MSLAGLEAELTEAVERLRPSVVRLERQGHPRRPDIDPSEVHAAGSGVIWDRDGLIVTNEHVVRDGGSLRATLANGDSLEAEVVGSDPLTDVAVVRVAAKGLPAAPRGDSAQLRVGQLALAIGNSLGLPGGPTVSVGVVSALNRPLPGTDFVLEGLLQTDAAINPGNSGGPLADLHGSVIGLNAAVIPFAQGVGFAVPVNTVASVSRQLLATGHVIRPWLGVHGVAVDAGIARRFNLGRSRGVLIAQVVRDGPAGSAGLRPGDVVLRVGSRGIHDFKDLVGALSELQIGGSVEVAIDRSGEERIALVRVREAPVPAA